jgi:hypothetical protein
MKTERKPHRVKLKPAFADAYKGKLQVVGTNVTRAQSGTSTYCRRRQASPGRSGLGGTEATQPKVVLATRKVPRHISHPMPATSVSRSRMPAHPPTAGDYRLRPSPLRFADRHLFGLNWTKQGEAA